MRRGKAWMNGGPVLPEVEIYADGACRANPGPGGRAATLQRGATIKELAGAEPQTPTTVWNSPR